ncbi:MAG: acyl-CoA dehydrogenase family protein [Myxococcota bacterium]
MDLRYGPEYDAFRAELRAFLAGWPLGGAEAALPAAERESLFRQRGIDAGYVYRHIPKAYGGAGAPADVLRDRIIQEEYAAAGAPGPLFTQGAGMLAPTLVDLGTEEQKRRFVRRALTGEDVWCQGYSEPGAGSDLASLTSRAELVGDEWVIHGHKIWTSGADKAHYMFGLFRTEPDAPKHAGISYLLLDMRAPGVTIRPLREMTGGELFNEVFLDGVRTPRDWIVGERGQGWQVSRATLVHERNMIGDPRALRHLFDGVVALARAVRRRGRPAIEDPIVRARLAEIEGYLASQEWTGKRVLTASARGEAAKVVLPTLMAKLYGTNLRKRIGELAHDLLGADALVAPVDGEYIATGPATAGAWNARYMSGMAVAIAGGASNIQRNIIAERGLGLPRDLRHRKR